MKRTLFKLVALDGKDSMIVGAADVDPDRRAELESWLDAGDRVIMKEVRLVYADGREGPDIECELVRSFVGGPLFIKALPKEQGSAINLDWSDSDLPAPVSEKRTRHVQDYQTGIVRLSASASGVPVVPPGTKLPRTSRDARRSVDVAHQAAEEFEKPHDPNWFGRTVRLTSRYPEAQFIGERTAAAERHWTKLKHVFFKLDAQRSKAEVVAASGLTDKQVEGALAFALREGWIEAIGKNKGRRYRRVQQS